MPGCGRPVNLPLAAGERHTGNLWSAAPLIQRGLIDIAQPDSGRCGGITHFRKIAALAGSHFVQMAPHAGTLGPVAEFAALHSMAAIPNAMILERFAVDRDGRHEVVTDEPQMRNGSVIVPDTPGLGADPNLDEIARFPGGRNASVSNTFSHAEGTRDEFVYVQPRGQRTTAFGRETG